MVNLYFHAKNKNTIKRKGKEPDKMMLKKSRILFYMTRNQIRLKSSEASEKDLVSFSNKNNVTTITLNNPGCYNVSLSILI